MSGDLKIALVARICRRRTPHERNVQMDGRSMPGQWTLELLEVGSPFGKSRCAVQRNVCVAVRRTWPETFFRG